MNPAILLLPLALAVAGLGGCDRPSSRSPTVAPAALSSAAGGSSSDPTHPSENIKPAENINSGTVSGLPELGTDASPPTVGDQQADPDKKAKSR